MATKALNLKMDESEIVAIKEVASVFHMSMTELVKNAVQEYLNELKRDPFYRLTANIEEASEEETQEILRELDSLSDDDLTIVAEKEFSI